MSEIKLEVGKTYVNRRGEEVRIVKETGNKLFPFDGDDCLSYTLDGRYWYYWGDSDLDLIAEVPSGNRHTFTIPDGVKEITLDYFGNRLVVEMVPEAKGPKPGDVCINDVGSVYIFKSAWGNGESHKPFAYLGDTGKLFFAGWCSPGRPATPEEAQPLFDALKKAGKRWNPEAMRVEEIPEFDRILEWVEENIKDGYYNQEDVAEAIEAYLKHKEDKK